MIKNLSKWCEDNLKSPSGRQIISCNWTRNNYEYLKNRWPDVWKKLRGKKIKIKGKIYYFNDNKNYDPIIINGVKYNRGGSSSETQFIKFIRKIVKNKSDISCEQPVAKAHWLQFRALRRSRWIHCHRLTSSGYRNVQFYIF